MNQFESLNLSNLPKSNQAKSKPKTAILATLAILVMVSGAFYLGAADRTTHHAAATQETAKPTIQLYIKKGTSKPLNLNKPHTDQELGANGKLEIKCDWSAVTNGVKEFARHKTTNLFKAEFLFPKLKVEEQRGPVCHFEVTKGKNYFESIDFRIPPKFFSPSSSSEKKFLRIFINEYYSIVSLQYMPK